MKTPASARWYLEDKEAAHQAIFDYVEALEDSRHNRDQIWFWNAKLYDPHGDLINPYNYDWENRKPTAVSENYVKSAVDTVVSLIAKNRPVPSFLTNGGDWSTQRKAKRLEKYTEGEFREIGYYETAPLIFRDSAIFGTGVHHFFRKGDRPAMERTYIGEIYVDQLACRFAPPRQLHRKKPIDREQLRAKFADEDNAEELDDTINRATAAHERWKDQSMRDYNRDDVDVIESWQLPIGDKPGRWSMSVDSGVLAWEEYDEEQFPFEWLYWTPPICGFYGGSLIEEVCGTQLRLHKLNRFVDAVHDRTVVPRTFVHVSDLKMGVKFNRTIGQVIGYKNRPPIFDTPRGVGGEIFQRMESLKAAIFEAPGVSRTAATSRKPSDLESGAALREFNDIHADRFATNAQRYEDMAPKSAIQIIRIMKEIAAEGTDRSVRWNKKGLVQQIKWSDVDMEKDKYLIDVGASSMLSRTTAGRKADLIDLYNLQLIDRSQFLRMWGNPDLEQTMDMETSDTEDIEAMIEEIRDGDEDSPIPPADPFQNLVMGVAMCKQAYRVDRRSGAPEHILDAYRIWVQKAEKTLADAQRKVAEEAAAQQQLQSQGSEPAPQQEAGPVGAGAEIDPQALLSAAGA